MENQELPPGVTRYENLQPSTSSYPETEAVINYAATRMRKLKRYSLIYRIAIYSLIACALGMIASQVFHMKLLHLIIVIIALASATVAIIFEIKRGKLEKAQDK